MKNPQSTAAYNERKGSRTKKIKNMIRMFFLAASIQHCTGGSNQGSQAGKRNKMYQDWNGKKLAVFTHEMILSPENPKEFIKKKQNYQGK